MDRRGITAVLAGALSAAVVVAVVVALALTVGTAAGEFQSPEAAVRATCHASHVLLQNVFEGNLRFVDWQRAGQPPHGAGWTALVRVDSAGSWVLDCGHGHFARFPLPG